MHFLKPQPLKEGVKPHLLFFTISVLFFGTLPSSSWASNSNQIQDLNATGPDAPYNVDKGLSDATYLEQALASDVGDCDTRIFHLLSHGRPGELLLEGQWCDAQGIVQWLQESQLPKDGQLNIYGCSFAYGKKGMAAVDQIQKATGLKVAASTNITGSDGDWVLEIGGEKSFTAKGYAHNLQDPNDIDGDGVDNATDLDDDNDGILDYDEIALPIKVFSLAGLQALATAAGYMGNPNQAYKVFDTGYEALDGTTLPGDVYIKPDGTRYWVMDRGSNPTLTQYSLAIPWDFRTATVDVESDDPVSFTKDAMTFRPDGERVYIVRTNGSSSTPDRIYEYSLDAGAWDISGGLTQVAIHEVPTAFGVGGARGTTSIEFNTDGTELIFVVNLTETVHRIQLPGAYDLSDIDTGDIIESFDLSGLTTPISGNDNGIQGLSFSSDGLVMIGTFNSGQNIRMWRLANSYDLPATGTVPDVEIEMVQGLERSYPPSGADTNAWQALIFPNNPMRLITGEDDDNEVSEYYVINDFDLDGIENLSDLDSDNDGISDLIEGGLDPDVYDLDGDGVVDGAVNPATGLKTILESNFGGAGNSIRIFNVDTTMDADTDDDGFPDMVDIDSDNDGIPDTLEADASLSYIDPSNTDSDSDGALSSFDSNDGTTSALWGASFTIPVDTDLDGIPDFQDTDSDNDTIDDIDESGFANTLAGADGDGDGMDNDFDMVTSEGDMPSTFDSSNGINDPVANNTLLDVDGDVNGGGDWDFREGPVIAVSTADLHVAKTLASADPTPNEGEAANFAITVTNNGPDPATNIVITDAFPTELTYVTHSVDTPGTSVNLATFEWTIPSLAVNSSVVLTIEATVNAGQLGNTITNTISSVILSETDSNATPDDLEETIKVREPGIDKDGDGIADSEDIDDDNDGIPDAYEVAYPALGTTFNPISLFLVEEEVVSANTTFANTISGITFSADGLTCVVSDWGDERIQVFTLTEAFELSSAITPPLYWDPDPGANPSGLANGDFDNTEDIMFADNGNYLFLINSNGSNEKILRYSLSPAYSVPADGTAPDQFASISSFTNDPTGMNISPAGDKLYIADASANRIIQIPMSNFDLSTVGSTVEASIATRSTSPHSIEFNADGTFVYTIYQDGIEDIDGWALSTPYDLSSVDSAVPDITITLTTDGANSDRQAEDLVFSPDGTAFYTASGAFNEQITQWSYTVDHDMDTVPNHCDLDSDNDGISDLEESGIEASVYDMDNNGVIDGIMDENRDGLDDRIAALYPSNIGAVPVDTDSDGVPDVVDIDADGDGIVDIIEGADTAGYVAPTIGDSDNDGILDVFESSPGGAWGGNFAVADTDSDGTPDYLDLDSDEDGVSDEDESGLGSAATTTDTDGDGLADSLDSVTTMDGDPTSFDPSNGIASPVDTLNDANGNGEMDFREAPILLDTDDDGIPDITDLDDDNDGIPDEEEAAACVLYTSSSNITFRSDLSWNNNAVDGTFQQVPKFIDFLFQTSQVYMTPRYQDMTNQSVIEFRFPEPIALTNIEMVTQNTGLFRANSVVRMQASNDAISWTDLTDDFTLPSSNPLIFLVDSKDSNGAAGNGYSFEFFDNATAYEYYRIFGVSGDSEWWHLDEVFFLSTIACDTDDDGIPNSLDLDSDGDGCPDAIEAGVSRSLLDANGQILDTIDVGTNGLANDVETAADSGTLNYTSTYSTVAVDATMTMGCSPDSDGDGIADNVDLDDDNDGIPDILETETGTDPSLDDDNDGIPAYLDDDDTDPAIGDTDGIEPGFDTDGDGVPNHLDLDADNDGLTDITEAGGTDTNGDGQVDYPTPGDPMSMVDADNDGLADALDNMGGSVDNGTPLPAPNTDMNGNPDYLDIDADDDGIPDNVEGQATNNYTPPAGMDTDQDGIDDAYDPDNGGATIVPENTDGTDNPDYQDTNSDNEGADDATEANTGTFLNMDADGDGLDDGFEGANINDGFDVNDELENGTTDTNDSNTDTFEPDFRDPPFRDNDGDGVEDSVDLDDDNDGIPDADETENGNNPSEDIDGDGIPAYLDDDDNDPGIGDTDGIEPGFDSDGDGVPNHFDLDADNDGIPDITEAGGTDTDGDGEVDYPTAGDPMSMVDADNDGLADALDNIGGSVDNGTPLPAPNTDMNGNPDYLDIDADDDGVPDNVEAQPTDSYVPPSGMDSDGDGIDDAYDVDLTGTPFVPENTDGTDTPDYQDLDADNDGVNDVLEAGIGTPTNTDEDGDGLDDGFEQSNTNDGFDPNDELENGALDTANSNGATPEPDFRDPTGIVTDTDGDGVEDSVDDDPSDPCIPVQAAGYIGYDPSNANWAAADCDGDGVSNGTEAGNGTDPYDNSDTDGDGVPDAQEVLDGTSPTDPCEYNASSQVIANVTAAWNALDCDGDGVDNGTEVSNTTDPQDNRDTDGDGVPDDKEVEDTTDPNEGCDYLVSSQVVSVTAAWSALDCDSDGVSNGAELGIGSDPLVGGDADGDGVSDAQEALDGTDPGDPCEYNASNQIVANVTAAWNALDCDGDGVDNGTEITNTTDPQDNRDTDGDGVPDDKEVDDGTDPNDGCDYVIANQVVANVSAAWEALDCDMDGVTNGVEAGVGTNPIAGDDSDGDGVSDAQEALDKTDPADPCDYNAASQVVANVTATWNAMDCDGDGVDNGTEITNTTDPQDNRDTDGDSVPDDKEVDEATDPNDGCDYLVASQVIANVSPAWNAQDCDMDGVTNGTEITQGTDPLVGGDSDGDGVSDHQEVLDGTDPSDPCEYNTASQVIANVSAAWNALDCDGDGVPNGTEITNTTDPLDNTDSDGDGVPNDKETDDGTDLNDPCQYDSASQVIANVTGAWEALDCDGDGVINGTEVINTTDPLDNTDTDGDGVPDDLEIDESTDPNDVCVYNVSSQVITNVGVMWNTADCDGDGVTNAQEVIDGTNPLESCDLVVANQDISPSATWNSDDCDGDGIDNGTEITNTTDPLDPSDPNASVDMDGDGDPDATDPAPLDPCMYSASQVIANVTSAWEALDCDGDGVTNGTEIVNTTNPLDNTDTDGDGVPDDLEIDESTNPNDVCVYNVSSQVITNVSVMWNTADCDGDGVTNAQEVIDGTNPFESCDLVVANQDTAPSAAWSTADCDGDGIDNGTETNNGSDPLVFTYVDLDGDGVNDNDPVPANADSDSNDPCTPVQTPGYMGYDVNNAIWAAGDCDGDGVLNGTEVAKGTDPYLNQDADGDGVSDDREALDGTNPMDPCEYNAANQVIANVSAAWNAMDCDGDGVDNGTEITNTTNPQDNRDTDGDGVPDDLEIEEGTDPVNGCDYMVASQVIANVSAAWEALDCDGGDVPNGTEVADGTDPLAAVDTDGDGVSDEREVLDGTDPNDQCDYNIASQDSANVDPSWNTEDCDGDGVDNGTELMNSRNPLDNRDTDGDGVPDDREEIEGTDPMNGCDYMVASQVIANVSAAWEALDCDNGGVPNGVEVTQGSDPLSAMDSDGDGVSDEQEALDFTNPNNGCDYNLASQDSAAVDPGWNADDCDGDGVDNGTELANGTDPLDNRDTDGDGVPDHKEVDDGTDPDNGCDYMESSQVLANVSAAWEALDCDNGGVTNGAEVALGTDPLSTMDSDGDGVSDEQESLDLTDPDDGCDYNPANQVVANVSAAWNTTDCDADGTDNGTEIVNGTNPLVPNRDSDGDGVLDDVDEAFDDPCLPVQEIGYTGYDATNSVWAAADCDGDGLTNGFEAATAGADPYNPDDDNDGILTMDEDVVTVDDDPTNDDTDGDGIPNYLDVDDDNDGLLTIEEIIDSDNDGRLDAIQDDNGNGIPDHLEENNFTENLEDLEVYNILTPSGADGLNDVLIIRNIEKFPDNTFRVYNRWGVLVWEASEYGSAGDRFFTGVSNGRITIAKEELLPSGTYYYVLDYKVPDTGEDKSIAGYLYIKR